MTHPALVTGGARRGESSLLSVAVFLLRSRRIIILTALICGFYVGVKALSERRTWTVRTSFLPQGDRSSSRLATLASQFGVGGLGTDQGQSADFYATLVTSKSLLREVVKIPLSPSVGSGTSLPAILGVGDKDSTTRIENAARQLQNHIGAAPSFKTGMVIVNVTLPVREAAFQVASRVVTLANDFSVRSRQERASADRDFSAKRLTLGQDELRAAEDRLKYFMASNRGYEGSPQLRFEYDRLQRDVNFQQQLVLALTQANEQARMDEARNSPVITIVEPPTLPVEPDPRRVVSRTIVALIIGTMLGILIAFLRAALLRDAEGEQDRFDELQLQWKETLSDLLHPWRLVPRFRFGRSN